MRVLRIQEGGKQTKDNGSKHHRTMNSAETVFVFNVTAVSVELFSVDVECDLIGGKLNSASSSCLGVHFSTLICEAPACPWMGFFPSGLAAAHSG